MACLSNAHSRHQHHEAMALQIYNLSYLHSVLLQSFHLSENTKAVVYKPPKNTLCSDGQMTTCKARRPSCQRALVAWHS